MTVAAAELFARCQAAGLSLTAEGEALHVDFERPPPAELAYAESVGRPQPSVAREISAAKVAEAVTDIEYDKIAGQFSELVEIHAARPWLWPALVTALVAEKWTVARTREKVEHLKGLPGDAPGWAGEKFVEGLVSGVVPVRDVGRCEACFENAISETIRIRNEIIGLGGDETSSEEDVGFEFWDSICSRDSHRYYFASYSDVMEACDLYVKKEKSTLDELKSAKRTAEKNAQKKQEAAAVRSARLLEFVSLNEWKTLDDETRQVLLPPDPGRVTAAKFNPQESGAIEWAQWSWNPITGCEHDCPYCYARDIANDARKASAFPNGFAPTLRPRSLLAPRNHPEVPLEAQADARFRNVFTGSMADIWGRWVPDEWIVAVLEAIRAAPQWNFLTLTKFPKRMAEFDIPENCWPGTTVDLQARVRAAEDAFAKVKSKVRWLSCEPLLEPLRFRHLDRFNWIVIGGASRSSQTPIWRPPYVWVRDLEQQADDVVMPVYMKTNLFGHEDKGGYRGNARRLELPWDAPVTLDPMQAPPEFRYRGK
jgi:protein gp37